MGASLLALAKSIYYMYVKAIYRDYMKSRVTIIQFLFILN